MPREIKASIQGTLISLPDELQSVELLRPSFPERSIACRVPANHSNRRASSENRASAGVSASTVRTWC